MLIIDYISFIFLLKWNHKITGNGFITPKKTKTKEVNRDLGASNFRKLQTQNSGNLNILSLQREDFLMFLNNACARL